MENYTKRIIIRMLFLLFIIFFSYDIVYPIIELLTIRLSYLFALPLKPIITSATTFLIGEKTVEISPACVAFSAYILLSILILTTKGIKKEIMTKMFLYGSLAILAINIIRIEILIYIWNSLSNELFELVHLFFWKVLSGVIVVLIWICLIRKYKIENIPIYSDLKYLIRNIRS